MAALKLVITVCLLAIASTATAASQAWRIALQFDDGGEAAGTFFVSDIDLGGGIATVLFGGVDIQSTDTAGFAGFHYTLSGDLANDPVFGPVRGSDASGTGSVIFSIGSRYLTITVSGNAFLKDAAPGPAVNTVPFGTVASIDLANAQNYEFDSSASLLRHIVGGSVVAVPEPGSYALLGLGGLLLCGLARRRRHTDLAA